MTYALLRHGQTEWNRRGLLQGSSDIPLNGTGRVQAHAAARALPSLPRIVVSSPLGRARETAEIIAGDLGVALGPSYDELVERDYGALEGTSAADALARWPDREYPGAEPLAAVAERGLAGLDRVATEHGDRDVLVVGHGTLLRVALERIAGIALPKLPNGAVAAVRRDAGTWMLLSYPDSTSTR